MDREAWYAAVHEIAKSQTGLSDWTELIPLRLLSSLEFGYHFSLFLIIGDITGFPVGLVIKNPGCSDEECRRHRRYGSILGSGRSPGGGSGNPLQYSCLENPTDRGSWWAIVHGVAEELAPTSWLSTHVHIVCFWQCSEVDRCRHVPWCDSFISALKQMVKTGRSMER